MVMMPKVYIGLEAHDGSGKSSTAMRIAEMFGGRVFFTSEEMKERRRLIYKTTPSEEKEASIHQTYLDEQDDCFSQTANSSFVVLDRTWFSHAVEQNVRDVLDDGQQPTYVPRSMPEGLHKPNLVFQILIPEEERKRRVESRGEELTDRDVRLNDDDGTEICWRMSVGSSVAYPYGCDCETNKHAHCEQHRSFSAILMCLRFEFLRIIPLRNINPRKARPL